MSKYITRAVFILMALFFVIPLLSHDAHAQGTDTYIVKPGDSLWKIAVKYEVGVSEIIEANPQIENPDLIYPNQKVKVPLIGRTKDFEQEVLRLTNIERQKNGLPKLKGDWELARVARYKARDMRDAGYFSHTSPNYGSPFEMIRDFGVDYTRAAENIAAGQRSPQAVVDGWMNSAGHRKNILNGNYTHLGVGYAEGGSYRKYWVQMFISQ